MAYDTEHLLLLLGFLFFGIAFFRVLKFRPESEQRKVLLEIALLLSAAQLLKVPMNLHLGIFDIQNDIPLHLCNFLPFVLVWVYASGSRRVWGTVFFWIILGVSQANLTPSVEFSLFHYDAIRYWMVHMGLVLLALYPALIWKWDLKRRDILRSVGWLNAIAVLIYGINLFLNSNYLYVMAKPPGTTFFSILPEWPVYILVLEVILVAWSFLIYGLFKWLQAKSNVSPQSSKARPA
ncbi:MAG: TIGR02206 family membrane protein [Gracilimonas sp.]